MPPDAEYPLLIIACIAYAAGFCASFLKNEKIRDRIGLIACCGGWLLHSFSLGLRWQRVGHGPFINLFEILSSNLWSLMLAYLLFLIWAGERWRPAARYLIPLPLMLMLWLLITVPRDSHLPATYDTVWLYFHVLSGKFFLGLLMLSAGLAIAESMTAATARSGSTAGVIHAPSYRLLAFAFCFESLMLLFGAIWAQDAWGRYWAWDPLETWAFLTWLSVIFVLHWRLTGTRNRVYAALVNACLVLAILTFFGVPFVSTAPHQGMV